jgi:hypothetical protein
MIFTGYENLSAFEANEAYKIRVFCPQFTSNIHGLNPDEIYENLNQL